MDTYGIVGKSLQHSFSPRYFEDKFLKEGIEARFLAFELPDISIFKELLHRQPELKGLCITIPYKESIIPYLDKLDEDAQAIGAVNCIAFEKGRLKGYNTDVYGFEVSLKPLLRPHHKQALILGTGGASKAVAMALNHLGIGYKKVSRKEGAGDYTYATINTSIVKQYPLLINTTPLGTYPETEVAPCLPYEQLTTDHLLYDLTYNPEETLFLKKGKRAGAHIKNGYEMLLLQASKNWDIWLSSSR